MQSATLAHRLHPLRMKKVHVPGPVSWVSSNTLPVAAHQVPTSSLVDGQVLTSFMICP